jgi:hypothetical protein
MWGNGNIIVPIDFNNNEYEHTVETFKYDTSITYRVPGRFARYIFTEEIVKFEYSDAKTLYQCELRISQGACDKHQYCFLMQISENDCTTQAQHFETDGKILTLTDKQCFELFIDQWAAGDWKVADRFVDIVKIMYDDLFNSPNEAIRTW